MVVCEPPSLPSSGAKSQTKGELAPPKPKKKRIRIKTERRREQCRVNQARYRDKQRAAVMDLEDAVEELKRHVQRLERRRSVLRRAIDTRDAAANVVSTYFTLFRHGLEVVDGVAIAALKPEKRLEQQLTFLHAVLARDVLVNDMRGRDVFVDQTRRFAVLFGHFEQRLQQLQHVEATNGNALLLASVRLDLTITDATPPFHLPAHPAK
ncbi:hypothetical protein PINS_up020607 [Pythium insidiosum]|nr:hypothetical protein PINS_up020607 [Pythium insidiosum]